MDGTTIDVDGRTQFLVFTAFRSGRLQTSAFPRFASITFSVVRQFIRNLSRISSTSTSNLSGVTTTTSLSSAFQSFTFNEILDFIFFSAQVSRSAFQFVSSTSGITSTAFSDGTTALIFSIDGNDTVGTVRFFNGNRAVSDTRPAQTAIFGDIRFRN